MNADALQTLVNAQDGHKEKQCQPYLERAQRLLLPRTPVQIIEFSREEPSRAGRSDFVISAAFGDSGTFEKNAYVWEVKSPQTFLFEPDDSAQRLRPTKDFIKAETQLAYYVLELQDSPTFRAKYDLDAFSKVIPAGIIIGRSDAMCKPIDGATAKQQQDLERSALIMRKNLIYGPAQLTIFTWDDVVRFLRDLEKPQTSLLSVFQSPAGAGN
jgi:hypothetical protein